MCQATWEFPHANDNMLSSATRPASTPASRRWTAESGACFRHVVAIAQNLFPFRSVAVHGGEHGNLLPRQASCESPLAAARRSRKYTSRSQQWRSKRNFALLLKKCSIETAIEVL